jgi:hypothetical protein
VNNGLSSMSAAGLNKNSLLTLAFAESRLVDDGSWTPSPSAIGAKLTQSMVRRNPQVVLCAPKRVRAFLPGEASQRDETRDRPTVE